MSGAHNRLDRRHATITALARGATVGSLLACLAMLTATTLGKPDDPLVFGTAFLFGLAPGLSSYVELTQRGRGRTRRQLIPWALWATVLAALGLLGPLYQLGYLRGVLSQGAPHEALVQGLERLSFLSSFDGAATLTALAAGFGLVTVTRITRFDWERHATWVLLGYPSLAFAAVYYGRGGPEYSLLLGLMISPVLAMVLTKLYDATDGVSVRLLGKNLASDSGSVRTSRKV